MPAEAAPDVKLSSEKEKAAAIWLTEAIANVKAGRHELEDNWSDIRTWYLRTEMPEKKDFPWPGAANLVMPVMPTVCSQLKSRLKRTVSAPNDPFSFSLTMEEIHPIINPLRKYIKWLVEEQLKLWDVMDEPWLEKIKLGTCVVKVIYAEEVRPIHILDETSNEWIEVVDKVDVGTKVIYVPVTEFFFPLETRDIEKAPWRSHRFRTTWNDLLVGAANGKYNKEAVENIRNWWVSTRTESEQETDREMGLSPVDMEEFELHEVWFEYPLAEGKIAAKLSGYLHPDSYTFLRIQHNWMPLQLIPFEMSVFEKVENYPYGTGAGTMSLPFHKEISTMHCQRLDGDTIRNANAFLDASDDVTDLRREIRPGARIPVDDIKNFGPLPIGPGANDSIANEEHTMKFLRERVGLNEPMPDMNRATATGIITALQESLGRFDDHVGVERSFLKRVMEKVLILEGKYRPEAHFINVLGPTDGPLVAAFLKQPPRKILDGIGLSVTATTASNTREVERQAKLGLFGMLTQYYGQLTQYYMAASSPDMPPLLQQAFILIAESLTTFVKDILEGFDIHNRGELILQLEQLQQAAAAQQAQGPPIQGPTQPPGVGGVAGGNGQRTPQGRPQTQAGSNG